MSKARCIDVSESGWPIVDPNSIDPLEQESVDYMDDPAWKKLSAETRAAYDIPKKVEEQEEPVASEVDDENDSNSETVSENNFWD